MAVTLLIFVTILQALVAQEDIKILPPVIVHGNSDTSKTCPSIEERNSALIKIKSNVINYLFNAKVVPECGDGIWYRVAHLNMTDSSQQCPSAWREYTSGGIRVCKRPFGGCPGAIYPVNHTYSKVCGRVIGYQYGSPDAFATAESRGLTINQAYLDGISITHGNPRSHIWSYAVGASENGSCTNINCPCSNSDQHPPSFVGNNYYCESAHQGDCWINDIFFTTDPLWDGQQCDNEGTCCTGANTPPWFSVDLTNTSSDDLEVRICHDQHTGDEGSFVQLLELYIQ